MSSEEEVKTVKRAIQLTIVNFRKFTEKLNRISKKLRETLDNKTRIETDETDALKRLTSLSRSGAEGQKLRSEFEGKRREFSQQLNTMFAIVGTTAVNDVDNFAGALNTDCFEIENLIDKLATTSVVRRSWKKRLFTLGMMEKEVVNPQPRLAQQIFDKMNAVIARCELKKGDLNHLYDVLIGLPPIIIAHETYLRQFETDVANLEAKLTEEEAAATRRTTSINSVKSARLDLMNKCTDAIVNVEALTTSLAQFSAMRKMRSAELLAWHKEPEFTELNGLVVKTIGSLPLSTVANDLITAATSVPGVPDSLSAYAMQIKSYLENVRTFVTKFNSELVAIEKVFTSLEAAAAAKTSTNIMEAQIQDWLARNYANGKNIAEVILPKLQANLNELFSVPLK